MKIKKIDIYHVKKETLSQWLFYAGILLAYWGSLNPWFLWSLGGLYPLVAGIFVITAMAMQKNIAHNRFVKTNFIVPTLLYALISTYMLISAGNNVNAYIANLFNIAIFFSLFRLKDTELANLMTFLSKAMGGLLAVSAICFLLYLAGFPFPGVDASFADYQYSYTNYFFFMIDDRSLFTIFPRFSSVFLEPGHMGTATVFLLMTQFGKWKRWYNVSLQVATLLSFSLAAYVLYVVLIFLKLWVQGRAFMAKLTITVAILAMITIGSFFYNNGENLLHDLIVMSMEVEDGELAGDNRVTEDFDKDFEKLAKSSDIIFGKKIENPEFGNSGFKVYIYQNGIVGLLLVTFFYLSCMIGCKKKEGASALIISVLAFIVRGYPLWYSNFIPFYGLAHQDTTSGGKNGEDANL